MPRKASNREDRDSNKQKKIAWRKLGRCGQEWLQDIKEERKLTPKSFELLQY